MLEKLPKENMFLSDLGWLQSRFHFSFAEYRDFDNMNFGVLRVLNDDIIHPNSGFDMHPHSNMEIITFVIDGELTHKDSMGHSETLKRGEVQYMSAGDGIYHSEYNNHTSKSLRLLQIWIIPPQKDLDKLYGSYKFKEIDRKNKLLNIVSSKNSNAKIQIYQDVDIFVSQLDENKSITYNIKSSKQIYFVQIEGKSIINNIELNPSDAMKIEQEEYLNISAVNNSHFLFIQMNQGL